MSKTNMYSVGQNNFSQQFLATIFHNNFSQHFFYLVTGASSGLRQDADDMCMICFTEALWPIPSIQLGN